MKHPRVKITERTPLSCWGTYNRHDIHVWRDDPGEDWYIQVRDQTGMMGYDGYWKDSADKPIREALTEAARGAGLWPPKPKKRRAGPVTIVLMVMPQFAGKVERGDKNCTLRPRRADFPPRVGDLASLREWTGRPYCSKQRTLREAPITEVHSATVTGTTVEIDGERLRETPLWEFADADGFDSPDELFSFFRKIHGLPFSGDLIKWEPPAKA